jgi:adenine-specific DNA-methyltransferase
MRYFGSKVSTVESVYSLISRRIAHGSFCDPFGGIGTVGSYFKQRGYDVWTGDILNAAHCFQVTRIQLSHTPAFRDLRRALDLSSCAQIIQLLNDDLRIDGWLTANYARERKFFTISNAQHIDACRIRINRWCRKGWVTDSERAVLLSSLINSVDRVANTAGTYYAYLKSWHRKALKPFRFEFVSSIPGQKSCHSLLIEADSLVQLREYDVLYLDPPFNERCYSSYYHLPETLAIQKTPRVRGACGIPWSKRAKSDFNRPKFALIALEQLLSQARFKLLAFHYSDDGLISKRSLRNLLRTFGKVEEFKISSRGYTTAQQPRTIDHRLYLVKHA